MRFIREKDDVDEVEEIDVNEPTEGVCRCVSRGELGTGLRGILCGDEGCGGESMSFGGAV